MSLNIFAIGNVVKTPETREAGSSSVTKFSLASNEYVKGEQKATFVNIEAWGQQGEFCARNFKPGSLVEVVGTLQQNSWEDKETGAKRSTLFIRADKVSFGPASKKKEEPAGDEGEQQEAPKKPAVSTVKKPATTAKPAAKPAPKKPAPVLETETSEEEFDANLGDIDIPGEGDES